jgi:hypothetical protein
MPQEPQRLKSCNAHRSNSTNGYANCGSGEVYTFNFSSLVFLVAVEIACVLNGMARYLVRSSKLEKAVFPSEQKQQPLFPIQHTPYSMVA